MHDTGTRPLPLGQVGGLALRYGENGWQGADLFTQFSDDPLELGKFVLEEGETPSATNLTDLDRGLRTMSHIHAALQRNAPRTWYFAVALKHGNCCGAGYGTTPMAALSKVIQGDLQAIMGGVVLANFTIGEKEAQQLLHYRSESRRLLDAVVASSFTEKAKESLARKAGKCRLISNPAMEAPLLDAALKTRGVRKGHLVQDADDRVLWMRDPAMQVHGFRESVRKDALELDLAFASAICRTSNSNTVTLVRDAMLIGQGVGQTRRDRASRLAVMIAKENGHLDNASGIVACSDSFFPFADGVEPLFGIGVTAIFSTSGAVRDKEVQEACMKNGVTLYQLPDKDARMFFGH